MEFGTAIPPYTYISWHIPNKRKLLFIGSAIFEISTSQFGNNLPKESSSIKHILKSFPQWFIMVLIGKM